MRPEWMPHLGTSVAWPHNEDTRPENLREAQVEFVQLVNAITRSEPVYVLAPQSSFDEISKICLRANNIRSA